MHPSLYGSVWMCLAWLAGGAGIVFLFMWWRLQHLERQQKHLAALVARRTLQLHESNAELRRAREAAESVNRVRSAFLANMSHDLRTPLNGILGYTQLLIRKNGQSPDALQKLRTILSNGENLLERINGMLDLSKEVESATVVVKRQPVALWALAGSLVDEFQLPASQKGLKFAVCLEKGLPEYFETDPLRLGRVLHSLVGNAIRFTQTGEVRLSVELAGRKLRFAIQDNGPGIPEAEQQDIFKPCDQATNNRFARQDAGLDLYICQRLVQLLDGQMGVVSAVEKGSVFWFELPMKVGGCSDEVKSPAPVVAYAGPRRRILVVEGAEEHRDLLRELLMGVGFDVKTVTSGEEAVISVLHDSFNAVISDLHMTCKDGISICRKIRELPGRDELPLIALSASVCGDNRREAGQAGFNCLLDTPVRENQLFATLGQLLQLEWVREAETLPTLPTYSSVEAAMRTPLIEPLPTGGQLDVLLAAARRGDIMTLRTQVQALDAPALGAFRQRLTTLVGSFRMGEVEQLLQMAQQKADPQTKHENGNGSR